MIVKALWWAKDVDEGWFKLINSFLVLAGVAIVVWANWPRSKKPVHNDNKDKHDPFIPNLELPAKTVNLPKTTVEPSAGIVRFIPCPHCGGEGMSCPKCNGSGRCVADHD